VTWALAPAIDARLDEVVVVAGAADLKPSSPSRSRCCRTMSGRGARRRRFGWSRVVRFTGHQSAVIGLGDMPGLSAEAWRAVADAPLGPSSSRPTGEARPPGAPRRRNLVVAAFGRDEAHARWFADVPNSHEKWPASGSRPISTPQDLQRWSGDHGTEQ